MMYDISLFWTVLGAAGTTIAVFYGFFQGLKNDLRNFKSDVKEDINNIKVDINNHKIDIKNDINSHIDMLDKKIGSLNQRMDNFEAKITSLEERMFWILTGKKLEDAILEERMKKPKTDP